MLSVRRQSLNLDHLGLVAAMYDELGIGDVIDSQIIQDKDKRILSLGQAVKAMVLNGLGFVNQNLYLVPRFFASKPTEALLGKGIEAKHINDDALGRALDAVYEHGVTDLFYAIAVRAVKTLGLSPTAAHLDSTSFHVDGAYADSEEKAKGVHITWGYSRDHRPDLKQVLLNLVVENKAGIPLLMKPADGNSQDKAGFRELIDAHIDQLQKGTPVDYIIADSALYSKESVQELSGYQTHWITRVPETIVLAKETLADARHASWETLDDNYRVHATTSRYGDVQQRWLVVHSKAAQQRASHALQKRFLRETQKEMSAFNKLCRTEYACQKDAQRALDQQLKRFKYIQITEAQTTQHSGYSKPGRPAANKTPDREYFIISGKVSTPIDHYYHCLHQKSCFIVATNQMDSSALDNAQLLQHYKGQGKVEKGFRFLKDPLFLADALFLNNSHRIVALMMIMSLCLMVYAALEYRIRSQLQACAEYFPHQTGKLIQNPTARWVFSYFHGIHVWLTPEGNPLVVNLDQYHLLIVRLLGNMYEYYYS